MVTAADFSVSQPGIAITRNVSCYHAASSQSPACPGPVSVLSTQSGLHEAHT